MGKVYLKIVSGDFHVGDMTQERYDELYDADELIYELDVPISNALTDISYELYYEEDDE